jgi:hypothetical protein
VVVGGRAVPQALVPHGDVVVARRKSVLALALLKAGVTKLGDCQPIWATF